MKNSNDPIGNQTRDLPARRAVPELAAPLPRIRNASEKKQHVLSTIVLMLDVITSFNFLFFPNDGLKK
jgi:hypothetical protein